MKVQIRGAGPIAMSLALFLLRQGLKRPDIDLDLPAREIAHGPAARAIALSDGSWQLLSRIIELPQSAAIHAVDIGVLGHGLHARLTPGELGLPALGRVVRYGELWRALYDACARTGLTDPLPDRQRSTDASANASASAIEIVADGRISDVADTLDFGQAALTAELQLRPSGPSATLLPRDGVAYERFKSDGPLALLPLPERHHVALVWCERADRCDELGALSESRFEQQLAQRLGARFAPLTLAGAREVVALRRLTGTAHGESNRLTIGNAAQSLHPVAGQGMNLGLRDAFEAASAIGDALLEERPATSVVKSFISRRMPDRRDTIRLTDMMAQLSERPHLAGLNNGATQSIAIGVVDAIGPLRRMTARRFVFGQRRAD